MAEKRTYFGFEQNPYQSASTVVIPVPFERSTSYLKGTAHAPQAILEASDSLEFYDIETDSEPFLSGIHTTPAISSLENESTPEFFERLKNAVSDMLRDDKFFVILGGEHSLSYPVVHAFVEHFPRISVLHIDAHADLRDEYLGDPLSHACALRRIRDVTSETVSVGIRSMSAKEAKYVKKERPVIFYDHQLHHSDFPIEEILAALNDDVYITFDLDGLNPAEMPSVGTPEPGGLSWHETLALFDELFQRKNVLGMDVVELKPDSVNVHSDFLAAKLIYKAIALKYHQ
ncbi:agmatinase [candidate division KSB1 bacterium 4484_87]|nr:MAG: agmatinase [candidate division KSB1 bacterium 4484_87]